MTLQIADIDDAVLMTQNLLIERGAFIDMQTDLTDHVAVREIWKGRQKKFSGGMAWEFSAMMDHNHSARAVGLFERDGSSINDVMKKGSCPVRHINAHYTYDRHEPDFQRGNVALVDLVRTRYIGMMVSFYELMEEFLWSKPADSTDDKTPYGLAYWITKSATEGFNGGNPAGFTDGRAGISSVAYPRFQNWTAQYADVTKTDLIRKMRKAHRVTQFRSPVSHATPTVGGMSNGIYANDNVIGTIEEVMEANNMNLGRDVAGSDGRIMFKSTPFTYAPKLDGDATDPVYFLDWKYLACGVLEGWENNLSKPEPVPGMHNVRRVDLDCSFNMICTDPRRQAVFSK